MPPASSCAGSPSTSSPPRRASNGEARSMSRSAPEVAAAVSAVFSSVFDQLAEWRAPIEQVIAASPEVRPADLDAAVAELVLPRIVEPDPLLVGAGFIAD